MMLITVKMTESATPTGVAGPNPSGTPSSPRSPPRRRRPPARCVRRRSPARGGRGRPGRCRDVVARAARPSRRAAAGGGAARPRTDRAAPPRARTGRRQTISRISPSRRPHPMRLRRRSVSRRLEGLATAPDAARASSGRPGSTVAAFPLRPADSRVDDADERRRRQVDDRDDHRQHHHRALHDREVRSGSRPRERRHPRPGEHGLGHDRTAQELPELEAEQGDDGDHGVAEVRAWRRPAPRARPWREPSGCSPG